MTLKLALRSHPQINDKTSQGGRPRTETLILVDRKVARLDAITKDLETRGADYARTWSLACATAESVAQLSTMKETLGGLDVLLLAYGALGDQGELQNDQNATPS